MIGFAEDAEDGTSYLRDQFFDRRRPETAALPLPAADGAVEHHGSGNVTALRRQQERLTAGLADADNTDALGVDGFEFFQISNRAVQVFQSAVVAEVDPLRAAQYRFAIAG